MVFFCNEYTKNRQKEAQFLLETFMINDPRAIFEKALRYYSIEEMDELRDSNRKKETKLN